MVWKRPLAPGVRFWVPCLPLTDASHTESRVDVDAAFLYSGPEVPVGPAIPGQVKRYLLPG